MRNEMEIPATEAMPKNGHLDKSLDDSATVRAATGEVKSVDVEIQSLPQEKVSSADGEKTSEFPDYKEFIESLQDYEFPF
ncbi:MAG: hypothetical protein MRJ65_15365 [Candidatus Brocadiaceae bacterium]|nr:hypothetical protein [Candidatus Brocadiaceae bacterium]